VPESSRVCWLQGEQFKGLDSAVTHSGNAILTGAHEQDSGKVDRNVHAVSPKGEVSDISIGTPSR
jgi:hypothetical protein